MIAKINASNIIQLSSAVAKSPGGLIVISKDLTTDNTNMRVDVDAINSLQEPNYYSWGLSTGYQVNITGSKIFDETSFGSSLSQSTIVNRGPNIAYVCFNTTGFVMSSCIGLESDESIKSTGPINTIWAASATGVAIIDGFGLPYINPNTI